MIEFSCKACQARYQVRDALAGREARCELCGHTFVIPAAPAARASAAVAPPHHASAAASASAPAMPNRAAKVAATVHTAPPSPRAPAPPVATAVDMAAAEPPAMDAGLDVFAADFPAAPAPGAEQVYYELPQGKKPPPAPAKTTPSDKRRCPHCDYLNDLDSQFCAICRKDLNAAASKSGGTSNSKEILYLAIGIGVALLTVPVVFILVAMAVSPILAVLISIIEVNLILAIGSFAVSCRLFGHPIPDAAMMFRIIIRSNLLVNIVMSFLVNKLGLDSAGWAGFLLPAVGSVVVAAILCVVYLEMPPLHALGIAVCYNIFTAILAFIIIFVLTIVFAGFVIVAGANHAQQFDDFDPPGAENGMLAEDEDEDPDAADQENAANAKQPVAAEQDGAAEQEQADNANAHKAGAAGKKPADREKPERPGAPPRAAPDQTWNDWRPSPARGALAAKGGPGRRCGPACPQAA